MILEWVRGPHFLGLLEPLRLARTTQTMSKISRYVEDETSWRVEPYWPKWWRQKQQREVRQQARRRRDKKRTKREAKLAQKAEQKAENRRQYAFYLLSDEWRLTRTQVLYEARYCCQRCPNMATQVHHTSYKNIGRERPEDLVAICGPCHTKEHGICSTGSLATTAAAAGSRSKGEHRGIHAES